MFFANGFIKCYSDISANLVYNSITKHKNKKKKTQQRALKITIMQCLSTAAFYSSIPLQIGSVF